jgi:hypothetical protein
MTDTQVRPQRLREHAGVLPGVTILIDPDGAPHKTAEPLDPAYPSGHVDTSKWTGERWSLNDGWCGPVDSILDWRVTTLTVADVEAGRTDDGPDPAEVEAVADLTVEAVVAEMQSWATTSPLLEVQREAQQHMATLSDQMNERSRDADMCNVYDGVIAQANQRLADMGMPLRFTERPPDEVEVRVTLTVPYTVRRTVRTDTVVTVDRTQWENGDIDIADYIDWDDVDVSDLVDGDAEVDYDDAEIYDTEEA